ncbi:unnamed protein product [Caenorhabditis angaria]|uniref:Uncharacterized protein n=1 Tax=Caenorhabditis angaria TaxID=860376 RepID=A0A9P1J2G2_9PELO|nr:unnamed protein product [Caenorhabditis angaria]
MKSQFAVLTLLFVAILAIANVNALPRQQQMRYGNSLPAYAPHALYRFYNSRQFAPVPNKRNNAEVVNHILKNFGTLDRLGDVGRR